MKAKIKANIIGSSSYLPKKVIRSNYLEEMFELEKGYIESRTGITERRSFDNLNLEEIYSDIAIDALKNSGLKSIDSIVVGKDFVERDATKVYEFLKKSLGKEGINICKNYYMLSNCPGSVSAIGKESKRIEKGEINNSLIISVGKATDLINKKDIKFSVLVGDGSGAIVLGKSLNESGLIYFNETRDKSLDYLKVIKDKKRFYCEMNGRGVTSYVLKNVPPLINKGLSEVGLNLKDIDYFIFHQANGKMLDLLTDRIAVSKKKVVKNTDKYGNTGIASPLITYDELRKSNKIKKGMHYLLASFGLGTDGKGMQANIAIFRE